MANNLNIDSELAALTGEHDAEYQAAWEATLDEMRATGRKFSANERVNIGQYKMWQAARASAAAPLATAPGEAGELAKLREEAEEADELTPGTLLGRLHEMGYILRADGRWDGNEFVYAVKEESDVAMLDDLLTDAMTLARAQKGACNG